MHYRPLLPNGKEAPLSWQIKSSFIFGTWPTTENTTNLEKRLHRLIFLWCALLLCAAFCGQFYEVVLQKDDIVIMIQVMLNLLLTLECIIRIGWLALKKDNFQEFLKELYSKIYFDENIDKDMHRKIRKHLRPANIFSVWYLLTMISFYVEPIQGIIIGERYLPYRMTIPFDYRPWPIYTAILIICLNVGCLVLTVVMSESYMLATSIFNLNGRFLLLEEEISNLGDAVLKYENSKTMADHFNQRLIALIKRNVDLIKFADRVESQFTLPLFVMMADSAVMLCLVAFNLNEMGLVPQSIKYIFWLLAKVLELVVLGYLGSVISTRIDGLGTTYYASGWEKVIHKSPNTKANVRTMKLITLAISFNQRPFMLTGMRFFYVSLETTVTILQVAGSYFTFLRSIR
uniref:Odorant receptor n=1 Tax=Anastrepha ludens TaxID=28586 RepID=A0A9E8DA05_9MUSC|nr:odorant receptor 74a-like [Anastrepha ludens]